MVVSCKQKKEVSQTENVKNTEQEKAKPMTLEEENGMGEASGETSESQILIKNTKAHLNDSILIRLQRTACFGRCPIYIASIYPSGKVIYQGEKWVEKEGNFEARMSQANLELILAKANEIDFFALQNAYDSQYVSDLPSAIISLRNENGVKVVVNRYQGPEKLAEFTQFIEEKVMALEFEPLAE